MVLDLPTTVIAETRLSSPDKVLGFKSMTFLLNRTHESSEGLRPDITKLMILYLVSLSRLGGNQLRNRLREVFELLDLIKDIQYSLSRVYLAFALLLH